MGMRIDCSNPVREFYLTAVLDAHGTVIGWHGRILTGRFYVLSLAAAQMIRDGIPSWKITVQREPTIRETYQATMARQTRQLTLDDVPSDLYAKARKLVHDRKLICTQSIQRQLLIPYDAAQQIIDHLEIEGYIGPPRDDTKYRDILKAG